jgi:2-methylcitrate dehydratase PrpD
LDTTLATAFAEFAGRLSHASVPRQVRDAARWHIVDAIGVCIAGADPFEDSGKAARKLAEKWLTETGATVLGIGTQCRSDKTALINGALAQALEMDDKHGSSLARPGSTVTPAVLAVADEQDLPFEDVVTAVIVGYEVMIRLGFVAGKRFLERGYHTSSLIGAFGTVCAVGNLLRIAPSEIVDALGIAGTFASGIQEATRTGSTSKILHGGWGAHSGIIALDLAMAGITGPSSVFEGQYGFFQTHLTPIKGDLDWKKAGEGLGTRWYLPDTAYKPYPCCQLLHAFIVAAKTMLVDFERDGVSAKAITSISARLAEPGLSLVTDPIARKRAPEHPHEARFSLPYTLAFALLYGDVNIDTFRANRLNDPDVRRLAALVQCGEDPESDYPLHCPALLEIEAQGKTYKLRVPFHPGSPEAPLSQCEVLDKFVRNTAWLFGAPARDVGASLAVLSERETMRAIFRRLQQPTAPYLTPATAGMMQC